MRSGLRVGRWVVSIVHHLGFALFYIIFIIIIVFPVSETVYITLKEVYICIYVYVFKKKILSPIALCGE